MYFLPCFQSNRIHFSTVLFLGQDNATNTKLKQSREVRWASFVLLWVSSVGICRGGLSSELLSCLLSSRSRFLLAVAPAQWVQREHRKQLEGGAAFYTHYVVLLHINSLQVLERRESNPKDSYFMYENIWQSGSTHRAEGTSSFLFVCI